MQFCHIMQCSNFLPCASFHRTPIEKLPICNMSKEVQACQYQSEALGVNGIQEGAFWSVSSMDLMVEPRLHFHRGILVEHVKHAILSFSLLVGGNLVEPLSRAASGTHIELFLESA